MGFKASNIKRLSARHRSLPPKGLASRKSISETSDEIRPFLGTARSRQFNLCLQHIIRIVGFKSFAVRYTFMAPQFPVVCLDMGCGCLSIRQQTKCLVIVGMYDLEVA